MSESMASLQTQLDALRAAWYALPAGGKAVQLSYNMGAGAKAVTYTPANPELLRAEIMRVEGKLGIPMCDRMFPRRAVSLRFR